MTFRSFLAAAILLGAGVLPAAAQQQQQQQSQLTDEKKFGENWAVQCFSGRPEVPCRIIGLFINEARQITLSVEIAFRPGEDNYVVALGVPLGVSLKEGLTLAVGSYKSPAIKYLYCDANLCYVSAALETAALNELTGASKTGKVTITVDGKGRDITFPLDKFSEAHSSMVSLARSKAGSSSSSEAAPANP